MRRAASPRWFYSYLPHGMSGGATSALIPLFAVGLGGGLAEVGIIAAATSIASVPALVLWGFLSDRLGRRRAFLLLGFFGSAASFLAMALSADLGQFYLANLLLGFLGSASGPVGAVLVMETTDRREWPSQLAVLSRVGGVGWVAGLVVGIGWLSLGPGLLGELGAMRALFAIGAALALLSGVLSGAWLPEPQERVDRHAITLVDIQARVERVKFLPMRMLHVLDPRRRPGRAVRFPRSLRLYLGTVFLLFTGFTAFYGFFPVFLKDAFAFSGPEIFAVFIASQVTSAASYVRAGRWISLRGGRPMQLYASLGRAVLFPSFLILALVPFSGPAVLAVVLLLHAGVGLCWAVINVSGSVLVSRMAPESDRAGALGAHGAVQGFGAILGPLLSGFVAGAWGYAAAIAASVAFVLAGSAALLANRAADKGSADS